MASSRAISRYPFDVDIPVQSYTPATWLTSPDWIALLNE